MTSTPAIEDIYPLTPVQQGILFHILKDPEAALYVQQVEWALRGRVDENLLARAWQVVVDRHPVLRTGFAWEGVAQPVQVVHRQVTAPIRTVDLRDRPIADATRAHARLLEEDRAALAELRRAPLLRLALVRLAHDELRMAWTHHHLILDGWSMTLVVDEVFRVYASLEGRGAPPGPPARRFRDFVAWSMGAQEKLEPTFWQERLAGFYAPTALPGARRERGGRTRSAVLEEQLSPELSRALEDAARRHGLTPSTLAHAAWALVLARHADTEDVVFGSVVSGRSSLPFDDVERMVGCFINLVPLRLELSADVTVVAWLREVQAELNRIQAHEHTPLARIQAWSEIEPGQPVFETIVAFENYPADDAARARAAGAEVSIVSFREPQSYPLGLQVMAGPRWTVGIMYDAALVDAALPGQLLAQVAYVFAELIARADAPLASVELVTPVERAQFDAWNANTRDFGERGILELFEAWAAAHPDDLAVSCRGVELSYAELDRRAGVIARQLRLRGVGTDDCVGVCLGRGVLELMEGWLGAWKAGAAFVLVDPELPDERTAWILDNARAKAVVTTEALRARFGPGREVITIDGGEADPGDRAPPPPPRLARRLAYVVYTSGSTGRPKGVAVEYDDLKDVLLRYAEMIGATPGIRSLQMLHLSFDGIFLEILTPLCVGGAVILTSKEDGTPGEALRATAQREGVEMAFWMPSALGVTEDHGLGRLRALTTGGDVCALDVMTRWARGRRLINVYGPTEVTITSNISTWDPGDTVRSGTLGPLKPNRKGYVLTKDLRLAPMGALGELYLGGVGLARGYMGRPDLTAERFLPNPYADRPGERVYRTGDLVRREADGDFSFAGRADGQVKVRGFRIELGEIESVLNRFPGVDTAIVVVNEDLPGNKRLVAYVKLTAGTTWNVREVRSYLEKALPAFMIPHLFMVVPDFVLNRHDKVDRKRLPAPTEEGVVASGAPRTEAEQVLVTVWRKILRREQVGIHDNFFELGGDSILSIQVASRARDAGLVIGPRLVFEFPTIAELAQHAGRAAGAAGAVATVGDVVPLTPIQRWFFDEVTPEPHHFTQSMLIDLRADVEPARLERALGDVIRAHDAFRLRFRTAAGALARQERAATAPRPAWQVVVATDDGAVDAIIAREQRGLVLADGALVRATWIDRGGARNPTLLLVVHHLVVDIVSWRILWDDLEAAYASAEAWTPPRQGAGFAAWAAQLEAAAKAGAFDAERPYWRAAVAGEAGLLPRDFPNAERTQGDGVDHVVVLPADATTRLLEAPRGARGSVRDLLLAALWDTLARATGHASVRIGLEGHGRAGPAADVLDVSRTVGWLTSYFPVRLTGPLGGPPEEILAAIFDQVRQIPTDGQGVGYGALRYLTGSLEGDDPTEVLFNYMGDLDLADATASAVYAGAPVLEVRHAVAPRQPRRHLLEVNGGVRGGRLELTLTYGRGQHAPETIAAFGDALRGSIDRLVAAALGRPARLDAGHFPLVELEPGFLEALAARVPPERVEDLCPLTPAQEGMLLESLEGPSHLYVTQLQVELEGPLDEAALRTAWQRVVERHGALRASFEWELTAKPLQVIERGVTVPFLVEDWRGEDAPTQQARLDALVAADLARGFALRAAPLARVTLVRRDDTHAVLLFTTHHLTLDGWSVPLVLDEVWTHYRHARTGAVSTLAPPFQLRTLFRRLARRPGDAHEAFWARRLGGREIATHVGEPPAFPTAGQASAQVSRVLPPRLVAGLEAFARARRLTLSAVLHGTWAIVMRSRATEPTVLFGSIRSGRTEALPGLDTAIGCFITTLPFPVEVTPSRTVEEYLRGILADEGELAAVEHTPLARVAALMGRSPRDRLFDVILTVANYPMDDEVVSDLRVSDWRLRELPEFPLSLDVIPGSPFVLRASFDPAWHTAASLERALASWEHVLAQVVAAPERRVGALEILADAERAHVIDAFNATDRAYPTGAFPALFAAQVARTPDGVAAEHDGITLTYRELAGHAGRLAGRLVRAGAGPDAVVALLGERSLDFLVAVVAIELAGAAYTPLDPKHPARRIAELVTLSDARLVICGASTRALGDEALALLPEGARPLVIAAERAAHAREAPAGPPAVGPDHLGYVIYTSGSTGVPKGAMLEQRGLVNHIFGIVEELGLVAGESVLQNAAQSFDISVWQLLGPLLVGARVHLVSDDVAQDPLRLLDVIEGRAVTVVEIVPTLLATLLDEITRRPEAERPRLAALRWLIPTGEALPPELYRRWARLYPKVGVINAYGPSECSDDVTFHHVRGELGASVPIGRPAGNLRVYVLDRALAPAPIGIQGELFVGGVGVGRGYLRDPVRTAEAFLPDPFAATPGARLYRTGDLGRVDDEGTLHYAGRVDHQVKLRGQRIELGEIEAVLGAHPAVTQVAAGVRKDPAGNPRLVAWVVRQDEVTAAAVIDHARARLPAAMVPAAVVFLGALPVSPNGKIDRKALPDPVAGAAVVRAALVAPRSALEAELHAIWAEILGRRDFGVDADFFELGGDSIVAIRLAGRIRQAGYQLRPRLLFDSPTIAAQALALERGAAVTFAPSVGPVPLTPVQAWYLRDHPVDPHHHNQAITIPLDVSVDVPRLSAALCAVIAHHDAFGMRFATTTDGGWSASWSPAPVAAPAQITLEGDFAPALDRLLAEVQGGLALAEGPLHRAVIAEDATGSRTLVVAVNHLVVDVLSWHVLLEDVARAYEALGRGATPTFPPTVPVGVWARRQAELSASPAVLGLVEHYRAVLTGGGEVPVDHVGGGNTVETLDDVITLADPATSARLREGGASGRAQELLLVALRRALATWSDARPYVVELEGHGRQDPSEDALDLSRTVGWLTSLVPVRLDFPPDAPAAEALVALRRQLERGGGVRTLTPGLLALAPGAPLAGVPAPQIAFNYVGAFQDDAGAAGAPFAGPPTMILRHTVSPRQARRYVLELNVSVRADGRLETQLAFSRGLHRRESIARLADALARALVAVVAEAGAAAPDVVQAALPRWDAAQVAALVQGQAGRGEIEDVYELTGAQRGILFEADLERRPGLYVSELRLELDGVLDDGALERAWEALLDRHTVLRSVAAWRGLPHPVQIVFAHLPGTFTRVEDPGPGGRTTLVEAASDSAARELWDPSTWPLVRCLLFRHGPEHHTLLIASHHLFLDGWSTPLLLDELFELYAASRAGAVAALPPVQPFAEFVRWVGRSDEARQEAAWRARFEGFEATSLGLLGPEGKAYEPQRLHTVEVTPGLRADLDELARRTRVTLSAILHGAWALLLGRYADAPELVVGSVVSGRSSAPFADAERMIGMFVNTLPLRVRLPREATVAAWLRDVSVAQADLRDDEHIPLGRLMKWLAPDDHRLFETTVIVESYPNDLGDAKALTGLTFRPYEGGEDANSPISLIAHASAQLRLEIAYQPHRLELAVVERLARQLVHVLAELCARPEARVGALEVVTADERAQLDRWNGFRRDFGHKGILELFEAWAAAHPGDLAVRCRGVELTYGELDRRADLISRHLHAGGVGVDDCVGVCFGRGVIELMEGLLGAWKAGAAFVLVDPELPEDRTAWILDDARVRAIVTTERHRARFGTPGRHVVTVDGSAPDPGTPPPRSTLRHRLAYAVYTSGSTGRPKGVAVEYDDLKDVLLYYAEMIAAGPGIRSIQMLHLSFDGVLMEILTPLIVGGAVILTSKEDGTPGEALRATAEREGVEMAFWMPSALGVTELHGLERLRTLTTGGDICALEVLKRWARGRRLNLLYGPTEISMICNGVPWTDVDQVRSGTLGPVMANRKAYVLSSDLRLAPLGGLGELYIGGVALARGYMGRPDLTAERFLPNPYPDRPGERIYRTGDLVRREPDGDFRFAGRADGQVKVRGYRIELGEIEAVLNVYPGIDTAIVIAHEDSPGNKRLVAYVKLTPGATWVVADVRRHLERTLPAFMVPNMWMLVDDFVLNRHDKVDRKRLPPPVATGDDGVAGTPAVVDAPTTEIERTLHGIWMAVLGLPTLGIHDNFFELGGDSILAIQVVSRAREAGLEVRARQMFERPTVAQLATVARAVGAEDQGAFLLGPAPLTPIQRWFLGGASPSPNHFAMARWWRLTPDADPRAVEEALGAVIARHDAFRLRFTPGDEGWTQAVAAVPASFRLERLDAAPPLDAQLTGLAADLDVTRGPLVRAAWRERAGAPPELVVVVHHLVMDEVSWTIFADELERAYAARRRGEDVRLPARTSSFARWARALEAHAASPEVEAQRVHWRATVEGAHARVPIDHELGADTMGSTDELVHHLDGATTRALLADAQRVFGARAHEVAIAGVWYALRAWTDAGAFVIDLEGHGRIPLGASSVDTSRSIGWFTSVYPVLLAASPAAPLTETFPALLASLRRTPEDGQGVSHGLLTRVRGDASLAITPDVCVNFIQAGDASPGEAPGLIAGEVEGAFPGLWSPTMARPHLLELNVTLTARGLECSILYGRHRHRRETIERFAGELGEALRRLGHALASMAAPAASTFGAQLDEAEMADLLKEIE